MKTNIKKKDIDTMLKNTIEAFEGAMVKCIPCFEGLHSDCSKVCTCDCLVLDNLS